MSGSGGKKNTYAGFQLPAQASWSCAVVPASISPDVFFAKFVATRTPCIIDGFLTDDQWHAERWTNSYLSEKAGHAKLMVEQRDQQVTSFGRGRKVPMTFSKLLDKLQAGDEQYYVTTQPIPTDKDGPLALFSSPLTELRGDFPLRPSLLGGLIPWQLNVWIGNNRHGTSTGLHHDFHDNLYCLLRGGKRFTVFSPKDAFSLATVGEIAQVHPNGLINYSGCLTRADGAHLASVRDQWRRDAEVGLSRAEAAFLIDQSDTARIAVQEAEKKLEACLDLLLEEAGQTIDGEEEGGEEGWDWDEGLGMREVEESEEESGKHCKKRKTKQHEQKEARKRLEKREKPGKRKRKQWTQLTEEEDQGDASRRPGKPTKKAHKTGKGGKSQSIDTSKQREAAKESGEQAGSNPLSPDNFCNFSYEELHSHPWLLKDEQQLQQRLGRGSHGSEQMHVSPCLLQLHTSTRPGVCYLKRGQLLYLPAGWFHEVTSIGDATGASSSPAASADLQGHFALNYWFHPPDNLFSVSSRSTAPAPASPYQGDHWQRVWQNRNGALQ
eukprot:gb/GEZN01005789.1/.p1 GENE.gb/GEZN01005789.1/~~gb/GEZN01005789.1/.p1  ORF type:complete len:559 (-),score=100.58 gb/GEZN01005789.1/:76-1728(-)